jgi:transcriptional regulator with XRE-family HTH domain
MARRKAESAPGEPAPDTIGAHLRGLRKQREMTLEQLSEATGISVSSLSRIENTQLGLNVEKVELLARALKVSPALLVSRGRRARPRPRAGPVDGARFIVDRARERRPRRDRELNIEYLFERDPDRALDCMHLTVDAISVWESEFVRHPGEKIIYVISGAAVVYCERQPPVILETGDSLYTDAKVWHSVVAVNGSAELLVTFYHGPDADADPFETRFFSPESWARLQTAGR